MATLPIKISTSSKFAEFLFGMSKVVGENGVLVSEGNEYARAMKLTLKCHSEAVTLY